MPIIKVDAKEWLDHTLKMHAPVVIDIGDQRDPYDVVGCKCGNPGRAELKKVAYDYKGAPLYTLHIADIIEKFLHRLEDD